MKNNTSQDIAVVGLVCRVPGADDVSAFWEMLQQGREGLRALTPAEKQTLNLVEQQGYIAAGGFIDHIDQFDADNYNLTARDAMLMDPQQRLWLQACHTALQITGNGSEPGASIGVFASAGPNTYLKEILTHHEMRSDTQATLLGNVPDCLATRVSYLLDLTGPSMTVQCGCSSSLVGIHQARLALLAKQCNAALVGGICIAVPAKQGYQYVEGGFASPDGRCRPFSEDAAGTVFSSGYGVVVVKRLADAMLHGDKIYAVIKGTAINNDGADKASFTAPSVSGQAAVIAKAMRVAGVTPADIGYIEAHGTATPIGDPIELSALRQAYQDAGGMKAEPYFIGSVKANIGHLDVAAGIVSFIKACLMLHHAEITPQINFERWNSKCHDAEQYFQLAAETQPFATATHCAGVSAFGFGGTNAHVILGAGPFQTPVTFHQPVLGKLIVLSEKSESRMLAWVKCLRAHLIKHPDTSLDALTYTLQTGRKQLTYRFAVQVNSIQECIEVLGRVTAADFVRVKKSGQSYVTQHRHLQEVQQAWLSGQQMDWRSAYTGLVVQKCELPANPLQTQSYWIDTNRPQPQGQNELATDVKDWLYQPYWRECRVAADQDLSDIKSIWLLSTGPSSLIDAFTAEMSAKNVKCLHHQLPGENPVIDWSRQGILPDACILVADDPKTSTEIVLQCVRHQPFMRQVKQFVTLVTKMSDLFMASSAPQFAMLISMMRGIGQEFPTMKTQLIDVDTASTHAVHVVIQSLTASAQNDLLTVRQQHAWKMDYERAPQVSGKNTYFKQNGVYIITGGLGDVASVHVDYLAESFGARLILTARSAFPPEATLAACLQDTTISESLRRKIMRVKAWRERGYHLDIRQADITNLADMRSLCADIKYQYQHIDGIIHIAGASSDLHYKILSETDWQHCSALFAPKEAGVEVIAHLAKDFEIKDCLVISSISSALTGIGLSAYGASHNLLDAIVQARYPHWRLMNWDAWSFYQNDEKQHGQLGAEIDKLAITPDAGRAVLKYAFELSDNWRQLFISRADLAKRHQYWAHRGFLTQSTAGVASHPRPSLHNEYVAPQTTLQQRLAALWGQLIGVDAVGIHDSFFELGGNSLLVLELVSLLQQDFQFSCSVVDIFSSPTIAQLAAKMADDSSGTVNVLSAAAERAKMQLAAKRQFSTNKTGNSQHGQSI